MIFTEPNVNNPLFGLCTYKRVYIKNKLVSLNKHFCFSKICIEQIIATLSRLPQTFNTKSSFMLGFRS